MAATDTIGQVQTLILQSDDNIGNHYDTNINGRNMSVNHNATYQQVDTALRALNGLTTNVYVDTQLITAISVNEKMAEE